MEEIHGTSIIIVKKISTCIRLFFKAMSSYSYKIGQDMKMDFIR